MTKKEFTHFMVDNRYARTLIEANEIIDIFTEAVMQAVVSGESVKLVGFGTFEKKMHAAKNVCVREDEYVQIPERPSVRFKPGRTFIDNVREGFVRQ